MNNEYARDCIFSKDVKCGEGNIFYSCSIGLPPEVRDYAGAGQGVQIGSNNIFREYVIVNSGAEHLTIIGDNNFLMGASHIGHDVLLGDNITIGAGSIFGGHCIIDDHATIGLNTIVHQGIHIGRGAMVGMGSIVTKDVEPFAKVYGNPAKQHGLNTKKMEKLNE